jgi:hypothetical protein
MEGLEEMAEQPLQLTVVQGVLVLGLVQAEVALAVILIMEFIAVAAAAAAAVAAVVVVVAAMPRHQP